MIHDARAPGDGSASASANRLTRLYIAALSAVALLTISGQLLIQFSLSTQVADARIVNLAGRQRMLSQKLAKGVLAMQQARDSHKRTICRQEVAAALPLFVNSHHALQYGDQALGLPGRNSAPIAAMFDELEPRFQTLVKLAQDALATTEADVETDAEFDVADGRSGAADESPELQRVSEQLLSVEKQFLESMDAIVFEFDREAEARVERLRRIETLLLLGTLAVLLLEGWLVFRPAVAQIERRTSDLVDSQRALRQAKEVAESASREKDLLLANVSHELRNPLHAILGYSDLVLRATENQSAREHLGVIRDAAETQLRLINDLLDVSQLTRSTLRLQLEPTDAHRIIGRCLSIIAPLAAQKDIQLGFVPLDGERREDVEATPAYVEADPTRLLQVLWNLVANAVKFSDGGRVTIHTATDVEREFLTITVRDAGPGIGVAEQARIFDPFYQTDATHERRHGGIGLGLAICKSLVERMGGSISLESQLGRGSQFSVKLRTASPPETTMPPNAALPAARGVDAVPAAPLRLLAVDDDPVNLRLLEALLTPGGHQVICANHADRAFELFLQQDRFDACLIDIQMPDVSGTTFARQLRSRQHARQAPVPRLIAVSAAAKPASTDDSPFDDWLEKPIAIGDLLRALPTGRMPSGARSTPERLASERWRTVLARLNGNAELLRVLADDFLQGVEPIMHDLRASVQAGDSQEQRRIAHLLRGQAAVFEATPLVHELLRYESADKASADEASAAIPWPRLEDLVAELRTELQTLPPFPR